FFLFQAEDGIRDDLVTGVQTCALPIYLAEAHLLALGALTKTNSRLIYNIGNGQGFSVLEVIESVRRVTGRPIAVEDFPRRPGDPDRKSTRLNSSHQIISYAVFCLKKKK